MGRAADDQRQRIAHGAEIGAEIDHIGDEQQAHDEAQQARRVVLPQIAGDALAGDAADAGADLLDRRHQRKAEQHDPAHAVAVLGADLGICGDAAGIVVGGAGDKAGPEQLPEPVQAARAGLDLRGSGDGHIPHAIPSFAGRATLAETGAAGIRSRLCHNLAGNWQRRGQSPCLAGETPADGP